MAKPGNEKLLSSTSHDSILYIIQIEEYEKDVLQLKLAWLPSDITSYCLGKSFLICNKLDNCKADLTKKYCDPQANNCKDVIKEECASLSLGSGELKKRKAGEIHDRIMTTWKRVPNNKVKVYQSFKNRLKGKKREIISVLNKTDSLKVSFLWQRWENTEYLQIQNIF